MSVNTNNKNNLSQSSWDSFWNNFDKGIGSLFTGYQDYLKLQNEQNINKQTGNQNTPAGLLYNIGAALKQYPYLILIGVVGLLIWKH